jgi:hypothetical protein
VASFFLCLRVVCLTKVTIKYRAFYMWARGICKRVGLGLRAYDGLCLL